MTEPYTPGPDDEFRGIIEFDCTAHLTPEERAAIRVTPLVTETDFIGVFEFDCSEPSGAPDPVAPPPALPHPLPGPNSASPRG